AKTGSLVHAFKAIQGPTGPKSFKMVNPTSARAATPIFKADSYVRTAGKAIGKGFIGLGFGVGATTGTTAGLTVAAAVLGFHPVGWAAIGIATAGAAVGVGATMGFNYLYDNNILDRKSTRLNSSHVSISYAVFCLK